MHYEKVGCSAIHSEHAGFEETRVSNRQLPCLQGLSLHGDRGTHVTDICDRGKRVQLEFSTTLRLRASWPFLSNTSA